MLHREERESRKIAQGFPMRDITKLTSVAFMVQPQHQTNALPMIRRRPTKEVVYTSSYLGWSPRGTHLRGKPRSLIYTFGGDFFCQFRGISHWRSSLFAILLCAHMFVRQQTCTMRNLLETAHLQSAVRQGKLRAKNRVSR